MSSCLTVALIGQWAIPAFCYSRCADNEIESLRLIKSPAEQDLMRMCGDITAEMFAESMRFSVNHVSSLKS